MPFGDVFERFGAKHFDRRAPFVPCGMHKTGVVHHVIRVVMGEKEMCDVFGQTSRADEVINDATAAIKQEEQAINAAIPKGVHRVVCDERGQRVTTDALAKRLQRWQQDARDVALIIGGADGLSAEWRDACDEQLRLSDLTLPHALARVLVLEQLYRAWSLNHGHPYHRA